MRTNETIMKYYFCLLIVFIVLSGSVVAGKQWFWTRSVGMSLALSFKAGKRQFHGMFRRVRSCE